jgi:hypothetical protein
MPQEDVIGHNMGIAGPISMLGREYALNDSLELVKKPSPKGTSFGA